MGQSQVVFQYKLVATILPARPPCLAVRLARDYFFFVHAYVFKGVDRKIFVLLSRTSVSALKTHTYVFKKSGYYCFSPAVVPGNRVLESGGVCTLGSPAARTCGKSGSGGIQVVVKGLNIHVTKTKY